MCSAMLFIPLQGNIYEVITQTNCYLHLCKGVSTVLYSCSYSRCQGYKRVIKVIQLISWSVRGRRNIKHENLRVLCDIQATRPLVYACIVHKTLGLMLLIINCAHVLYTYRLIVCSLCVCADSSRPHFSHWCPMSCLRWFE